MKLKIKTHLIPLDGCEFTGEIPTEGLFDPATAPLFTLTGPMTYRLFCSHVNGGLVIRGTLSAPGRAECCSCLEPFDCPLNVDDLTLYIEKLPADGVIDIGNDVREELLTMIPDFPRCQDACAGICPVCGVNRNENSCLCPRTDDVRSPWDALNPLKNNGKA